VTHALPVQSSTFSNCFADASGLSTALDSDLRLRTVRQILVTQYY
jgi:hypothetical protein